MENQLADELCVICGDPVCVNESDEPVCQECLDGLGLT